MGTGKVLTEEDFKEGDSTKDTSKAPDAKDTIPADEVIEVKGKEKKEPEKEVEPSEGKEESLPKPSDKEPPKYKYASMEEYDKGYKEAEKKMHEATTENARLKRELDDFKKPKEPINTLDDQIKELRKETMQKIRQLPADSPTRDDDAADLWMSLNRKITKLEIEEERKKESTERDVIKRTYDRAVGEGLKTDAELRILGSEFTKTDPNLPIDSRIENAITSTKGIIGQLREGFVEKQKQDTKEKDDLKVLGRGSSRREKSDEKEDKRPDSMSQALVETNERRRLKKDDLYR